MLKKSQLQQDFFMILILSLESDGEWMVENYYTMQVNLQINSKNHNSQKTSLLARTAYLGNKERCQLSLENKIINQIVSFFYF